jgi:hypothetical protein
MVTVAKWRDGAIAEEYIWLSKAIRETAPDLSTLRSSASQATLAIADSMTSATACGWEIMITCEPSSSVMVAPARSA